MKAPNNKHIYTIVPGSGGLSILELVAPDGACAAIYFHGAHIASWIPISGQERLFMSRKSQFRPDASIRGGIPVVFPQFGASGSLPLHDLARLMPWDLVEAQVSGDRAAATFRLCDTDESRCLWPHAFLAELTLSIGGNQMDVTLSVTNTGVEPFTFTTSFHTYLSVSDIAAASVEGLAGLRYRDAAASGVEKQEESARVDFTSEVNRIYFDAPVEARLVEPDRTTLIQKTGFTDTVVWNPAAEKCATMADLEPDDYRRFVCVEAATVGVPVQLLPGESWQGKQSLAA